MAGQKFTLTFDAQLNVSQMNGALKQIQSTLNGLHLPQNITRGLQSGIDKLQKEITSFESLASKDITSKADMSKLETQAQKVTDAFNQLRRSFSNLTGLSGKDLEKLFPSNISKNITDSQKALANYKKELDNATSAVKDQKAEVDKLNTAIADLQKKKTYTNTEWKQLQTDIKDVEAEIAKYKQLRDEATNTKDAKEAEYPSTYKNSKIWRDAEKDIQKYNAEIDKLQKKLDGLRLDKLNGIKQEDQLKELQKLNNELTTEQNKLQQLIQIVQNLSANTSKGGLQNLINQVGQLTGLDMSQFKQTTEGVGEAIRTYLNQQLQQLGVNLNNAANSVNNTSGAFNDNRQQVHDCAEAYQQFNNQARDVEQLKSRIQYFFSLNNAIQLVRRTLREAYETIKELDKAMTETAVVTDFSVGDMWAQLPDYTARANELGVTTKAAYEAATLFYQQGLKTNEVMAMSNETLKMARIAGLDAAVATDRMTNAIRGFNMEINETNAQRIDDVYSRLAAISASNVDEISTAMTKVASLAHSANMEFETTAAFLAQIIETTRESAETAGTALKTVVARFSEVKKLVDEGELSGKDEEGELIDVNKVSEALRTAGIDLNKYFLGEVGLDDIFMELASKWDSLTTIQQRYIATQAAGSRQQSRFIALMSDYARTQELVGEAYNANGAAAKQFAKTQESLESKLARLKNAWNEFAMGILNSDLVKAGVDLLTNILNGINALTSGFGSLNEGIGGVTNSLSKLLMLFGGLGLGKTLLGGLTASISNIGLVAAGKAPLNVAKAMATSAVGANATGAMASLAGRGAGGAILAGFLNPFASVGAGIKGIGQTIWGGLQTRGLKYGAMGPASGLAAKAFSGLTTAGVSGEAALGLSGIASLAPVLLGVAAAATAVVTAYKLWEKYTPEGQLKTAQKHAEALEKEAAEAQETAQSIQSLKDSYDSYTEAVNEASTVSEREEAIQSRNEAILKAIEENPDYAEFLESDFSVDGELVLTLNEEKVTQAATDAAAKATELAIQTYFAKAEAARKAAEVIEAKQADRKIGSESGFLAGGGPVIQGDKSAATAAQRLNYLAAEESQIKLAYATMIKAFDFDIESDVANNLASSLSKIFIETGKEIDSITVESIARGLKEGEFDPNIISSLVAENLKFSLADLELDIDAQGNFTNEEDVNQFFEQLGLTDEELEQFGNVVVASKDLLKQLIVQQARQVKTIQSNNRSQIYKTLLENGVNLNKAVQDFINALDPEGVEKTMKLLTSGEELLKDSDYTTLMADIQISDQSELEELYQVFSSINLDNPLAALSKLNDYQETGNQLVQKYVEAIKDANSELFDHGNIFQSFIKSDAYEDLTESIEKLVDENGKLTTDNIEELIKDSKELQDLVENDVVSVDSLRDALNALSDGAPLEGLTEQVLDAFDATTDLDDMIQQLHETIANFDAGIDYGEGTDFIVEQSDALLELINNYEFGNQQFQKIWTQLFGSEQWDLINDYITSGEHSIDEIVEYATSKVNQLRSWADEEAYDFMVDSAKGLTGVEGISTNDEITFEWNIGKKTTEELRQDVADALDVSLDSAMAIIEAAMDHMPDLKAELDTNDYQAALSSMVSESGNTVTVTEAELDALKAKYGELASSVEQDLATISEQQGKTFKYVANIEWVDANGNALSPEGLKTKFQNEVGMDYAIQHAIDEDSGKIDADKLLESFDELGLDEGQADTIAHGVVDTITSAYQQSIDDNGEINLDKFAQKLAEGGLSEEYASSIADKLVEGIKSGLLTKTVSIKDIQFDEDTLEITPTVEKVPVSGDSFEELEANAKAKLEESLSTSDYSILASKIAGQDYSGLQDVLSKRVTDGITQGAANGATGSTTSINAMGSAVAATMESSVANGIISGWSEAAQTISSTPIQASVQVNASGTFAGGAAGGIVKSYSKGSNNNQISPGTALTGEEGPEIVWNKERGYAYITGANGPEFQDLIPGDRIFNAQETSRIFRNTSFAKGGYYDSWAKGSWNKKAINERRGSSSSSGSGSSSSSSDSDYTEASTWRNELDWLYDLMEDIAEYERQQTIIQSKYELAVEDLSSTGRDLFKLTQKELVNLQTQLKAQETAYTKRLQQMGELQTMVNAEGYGRYVQWNQKDQTLEIDWDAIEAIQDKDTYDEVTDWIDRMEEVQDQLDDANETIWDIKQQIQELQDRYLEKYLDFQDRVMDAVVAQYQSTIDNFSELNDRVNDTNSAILDSIQKEIDLERQIRDNTDIEKNITDMEARLAYMQRDTTGANEGQIRALEKQLEDARESYSDTLVDQAVDRLSEANDAASAQREKQIELMQAQLDYWQESGGLWGEVANLIASGFASNGSIITGSDLWETLKKGETWDAMSAAQKKNWANELILETNEVGAHLIQISDGNTVNSAKVRASIADERGILTQNISAAAETVRAALPSLTGSMGGTPEHSYTAVKTDDDDSSSSSSSYTTDELNSFLSTLDDNFLQLADVMPAVSSGSVNTTNNYGNSPFNVNVNVGSIASDYDVDSMINRIKDELYSSASYRTGNVLSFTR